MTNRPFSRIAVVGLGYIGLPTAAMFAACNIEVVGIDVNKSTVDTINRGEIHIVEPELDIIVQSAVKQGLLWASTVSEEADAFLIAVPTPFKGDNHQPDLSYIEAAAQSIAPVLKPGDIVILESTSPVGTTERMAEWLRHARPDLTFPQSDGEQSDVRIAHCPERVLPGRVMQELITNDRIIGGMTQVCSRAATLLYKTFVTGECVVASSPRVAEMAKLVENSYRDVNIAFANELSMICDQLDLDVSELIRLANRHPRVDVLRPGPGVGGHCIAVDPWFIVSSAPEHSKLIRTARQVNDAKPEWVLEKIRAAIGQCLMNDPTKTSADVSVAVYGLTFKPDIDDLRGSPALKIARTLSREHTGPIMVVEPNIHSLPECLSRAKLINMEEALCQADIHIKLVDHQLFRNLTTKEKNISKMLEF